MRRLAEIIALYFEKKHITDPKDREVYIYGLDGVLYTFFSTLGLLLIGLAAHRLWETAVLIGFFYVNQTLGGGFHASTHFRCFASMAAGLALYLAALRLPYHAVLYLVPALGALALLFVFPLVLHKNKQYLRRKRPAFIRRSRMAIAVQALILLAAFALRIPPLVQAICLSLLLCALSRLVAALRAHA